MVHQAKQPAGADNRAHSLAQEVIEDLYATMLDRVPAEPELAGWTAALLGGMALTAVRQAFVESDEFRGRGEARALMRFVSNSGLFDSAWYAATYPDIGSSGVDPLRHFCSDGLREGRMPNAYLMPFWYKTLIGLDSEFNAFKHYVEVGDSSGFPPSPNFDPVWYRNVYGIGSAVPALKHFLANRHKPDLAPCARLWSVLGLPQPGTIPSGLDVFGVFLNEREGEQEPVCADAALLSRSGLFDENFYALHSSDVLEWGMNPLEHFCQYGWREGRNPNFYFDIRWYLATNPDVKVLEVNPLVHYFLVGERAGRRPIVYFLPDWYRRQYGVDGAISPLAHYLAHRRSREVSPNDMFDPAWYAAQSGVRLSPNRDPFPHFLNLAMTQDVEPSSRFDTALWRKRLCGRPSRHFVRSLSPERDNPLILYLASHYASDNDHVAGGAGAYRSDHGERLF